VSEILSRYGHNGIAVEIPLAPRGGADHTVKAYLVDDVDSFAKVSDARDALGHLQAFGLGPIGELAVRTVDDENWLEAWKATVTPVRIGRFLVRPTWSDASAPDAITIALDPGMAFGTGLHPTTQQCLEAVSYMDVEGLRVLDVGTGSGILAIAAAKRGAREVGGGCRRRVRRRAREPRRPRPRPGRAAPSRAPADIRLARCRRHHNGGGARCAVGVRRGGARRGRSR